MGCASYQRLASEHQKLSQRLSQVFREKQSVYEDKIQLESEVSLLKKSIYEAVNQAETMKKEMISEKSTENPEIFESGYDAEVIGDWLEMDLRDGDQLLEALTIVYPPAIPSVVALQSQSLRLRRSDSCLRDYLAYFSQRFDLFYSSWREILSDQKQVDTVKQQLKQDLMAAVQRIESFVGKRSDALNEIHAEFRRICDLQTTDFLREQRNLQRKLSSLVVDMYTKRLEEKDVERARVIHLLEGEIQKLTQRKDAEIEAKVRREVQTTYEERLKMLGEEMLAATSRHHMEKELIQSVLTEEIEQRVGELKQMKHMHKHDKAILTRKYAEEISNLRKENEALKREQLKATVGNQEELRVMKEHYEREVAAIAEIHSRELADRDAVLTGLRTDFLQKSDSQKAAFEEKVALEKSKFAAELAALETANSRLVGEIAVKDAQIQEFESRPTDLIFFKLVSGLLGKLSLLTHECESKITETLANLTHFSSFSHASPAEIAKSDAQDRVKEAESALFLLSQQGEADLNTGIFAECLTALTSNLLSDFYALVRKLEDSILLNYRPELTENSREIDKYEEDLKELRKKYADLTKKSEEEIAFLRGKSEAETWRNKLLAEELKEKAALIDNLTTELNTKTTKLLTFEPKAPTHPPQPQPSVSKLTLFDENSTMKRYILDLTAKDAHSQLLLEAQQAKEAEIQLIDQRQKLKTALARINSHIKTVKRTAVFKWQLVATPHKPERGRLAKTASAFSLPPLSPKSDKSGEVQSVDLIFAEEQRYIQEKWAQTRLFRSISRSEAPLFSHEAFTLLDELLDSKAQLDAKSIATNSNPQPFPQFALEWFSTKFGSEKQGKKALGQALLCLLTHVHENQSYAEFICALLNFGVAANASLEASVFLVKSRQDLGELTEKLYAECPEKRGNVNLHGGLLFLADAFEHVYGAFAEDGRAGELILRQIRPVALPLPQYVIFLICHKMAKAGVASEDAFLMLDKRNTGLISETDFVEGVRKGLQVWVSNSDLSAAFEYISGGENYIQKEEFLTKLAFEDYILNRTNPDFSVTRANVLKSMFETAKIRDKEIALELLKACGEESPVSFRRFSLTVLTIDPSISNERMKALWYKAEELAAPGSVTPVAVIRTLLRHRLGDYSLSPFCKRKVDEKRLDPTIQPLKNEEISSIVASEGFSTPIRRNRSSKALIDPRFSA